MVRAVRTAWAEAMANVLATPLRFGLVAVAVAASMLIVGWREASLVGQLDQDARNRVRSGEFISVVVGVSDRGEATDIPGTACDALAELPGVVAAGVVRQSGRITVDSHPDGGYQLAGVSPGFLAVAQHRAAVGQILVGAAAAAETGLRDGAVASLRGTPMTVAVLADAGARTEGLARSFVTVHPAGEVTGTCYVEFASTDHRQATLLLPGLLGQRVQVSPLVNPATLGTPPADQYRQRPDRWLWVGLAMLPLVPGALVTRARRSELALYAILGAGRGLTALVLWCEWLILCVPGLALAVPVIAIAARGDGAVAGFGVRALVAEALLILLAAMAVCVLTVLRRRSVYEFLRRAE